MEKSHLLKNKEFMDLKGILNGFHGSTKQYAFIILL